jgi:two-component system response regulator HydG
LTIPDLVVLSEVESFSALWPGLARELDAELRVVRAAEDAAAGAPLAVLLVVAGAEEEAEERIRALRAAGVPAPLVVGARPEHRLAIHLLQAGAGDYFALPEDVEALRAHLTELRRRASTLDARARLVAAERATFDFGRIVGRSVQLRAALDRAARIIPHDRATILVTGETGTGKELLARAIHFNGRRAAKPFVEINCAAIPANLLESELFGHEKGAFTDARSAKPGLLEAADGGTLFLDEIGHLPFELQGKVLKAIEEKRVRRVGAVAVKEVDVRIIAATHVDLAAAVGRGEFREDLFYRLSVVPIHLPPLRERGDDVLMLAQHFLHALAQQYGLAPPPLSSELRGALLAHSWPGNVRELRNALERALLLGDSSLAPGDLFHSPRTAQGGGGPLPFPAPLAEIERAAARVMLERLDGNKKAAADALGISRSRLYRLLDDLPVPG